ncbi:16S rRNA methyltransferase [Marinomonas sp. SBI22]|uniref:class I SAM-dependent methyltransferase n=1 Tax=unclassified Marinomonas TaxID=196814 RepID=UPI0007AF75AE|nr:MULTISPECIES: class I SAM-dependent methyltransferase [unclassified Marinomonas]KZM40279.1 16S rRNA methyltransferase [Marinomonas sp. SBI22]KZM41696.1 16S rRNA methyltransferase [Marinomonas sp. SBI8L]
MSLNSTSLLLERSASQFTGKVLFANPEDSFPLTLLDQADCFAWCQSKTVFNQLSRAGMDESKMAFAATWEHNTADFDHIIIYQPKAKELLDYLLAVCLPLLKMGGQVWLVGDNKSGVKSAYKKLNTGLENVGKVEGAKHCLLYVGDKQAESPAFNYESWVKTWTQEVAGKSIILKSLPGVFGHGKLDLGTKLFLEQLDQHRFMSQVSDARMLDFGCGDGIISIWLAMHTNARITALDDSALAIEATKMSCEANGVLEKITFLGSNGLTEVKGRFNYIFSNPPFHKGTDTDYSIAENFIMNAKQHLTLNGELFIVANDFLRYPSIIDAALGTHTRLNRAQGFAIYHARQKKPK